MEHFIYIIIGILLICAISSIAKKSKGNKAD